MARKKTPPKPMFDLRHDFVESLENVCQQGIMLLQTVDLLLKHDLKIPDSIKEVLKERHDAFRSALMNETPEFEGK